MGKHIFSIESYKELISGFRKAEYSFIKFTDRKNNMGGTPYVIMRHDVDFCLQSALGLAEIENKLGVKSTFFFLLRSSFYNLIGNNEQKIVRQIFELGHEIALHFDVNAYANDYLSGFSNEISILKSYYPQLTTKIVSIHRPGDIKALLSKNFPVAHTYEDRFFRKIGYISDSDGEWKYGHPFESKAFLSKQPIQLATHPLWWIENGKSPIGKLRNFLLRKKAETIYLLKQALIIEINLK